MTLAPLVFFVPLFALTACDSPGGRAGPVDVIPGSGDTTNHDTGSNVGPDGDSEAAVCDRWNADRADLREGTWTGSSTSCDAGDILEPGRENTLRQVNLYRWLAGLPPVEVDARKNEAAQACALLMHANNDIEHVVPTSWKCYDSLGSTAAGLSNLATTGGVEAIDLYMTDEDVAPLGHRRWVLSNSLGPIGMGSTARYSCLHVINGSGNAGARWTAWPPPGIVPYEALEHGSGWSRLSTDNAGWSVQSDAIDLRKAEVTITRDGQSLPIRVESLASGYGSTFAIAMHPDGWATAPGASYHVNITNLSEELDWDVHVIGCE